MCNIWGNFINSYVELADSIVNKMMYLRAHIDTDYEYENPQKVNKNNFVMYFFMNIINSFSEFI